MLPEEATQGFLHAWATAQATVLARSRERFAGVALLTLAWQPAEVLGVSQLARLGEDLYGTRDPGVFFRAQPPLQFREEADGHTVLSIAVPNVPGEALDLRRREQELIVAVGGWRRVIPLSESLAGRPVKARLAGGKLSIRFEATS